MITNYIRHLRILRTLRNNVWLKTSELEAIQDKKLKILLNHAYRNVPYYHQLFDSVGVKPEDVRNFNDLSKIPITTKSQLKAAKKETIARNIGLNNCVEHVTSGSTGMPLTLFFSEEDAQYAGASYDKVRMENGFRLFRDVLLCTGDFNHIPKSNSKKWYQHLGILRSEGLNVFEPLDAQIQVLKKVEPDVIWGYPSAIKLLAKEVQEKNIEKVCPRLIFTASEVLGPKTRDLINSVFNVDLFDVYGAWESGCMAWECDEHAGYHKNMDTVLMEFVEENGELVDAGKRGKVVVTNLHSYAMPIIRYELGDFAIPTDEECSCGRGGYLVNMIEGRAGDFVKVPSGGIFSPIVFEFFMERFSEIAHYQIIQEKEDRIAIKMVMGQAFSENTVYRIETELKDILGNDVLIEPKIVEEINKEKSGKLRSVVSKIKVFN